MRGAALLVLGLVACGPRVPPSAATPSDYPTVLRAPERLGGDFVLEQEVTMEHPRGRNTFRAVLQKRGPELVLLVLAPHGGRAFALTQRGEEVEYESWMPQELPFPPRFILHDVHRTWFLGPDIALGDERLSERREGDRVLERRYERTDGLREGAIVIRYEGGLAPGAPVQAAPPDRVVLDNGWFGYRATVRTLSWQRL